MSIGLLQFLFIDCILLAFLMLLTFLLKKPFRLVQKPFFNTILYVGAVALLWEIIYVLAGLWEYNSVYTLGLNLIGVPVEKIVLIATEIAITILVYLWIKIRFQYSWNRWFLRLLLLIPFLLVLPMTYVNWYDLHTLSAAILLFFSLLYFLWFTPDWTPNFLVCCWTLLVPYCVLQLTLTGYFSGITIFNYQSIETQGAYILSFPIEDLMYWFVFQFVTISVFEKFNSRMI